jgi:DNA-binding NarL/FixJ family response regulator
VTPPRQRERIVLVDDHAIVREGLRQIINASEDLVVCGEADDAQRALAALAELHPDFVIVDITLRGVDGLELIRQVQQRWPRLPILVLSMHSEELYAERALRAGARGYIMKQEATRDILVAIRRVLGGELYVSPTMQARLLRRVVGRRADLTEKTPIESLSDRELEVFRLIGSGLSTREIAEQLRLSVKTVESYREHIKKKLRIGTGAQLIRHALQWTMQLSAGPHA